MLRKLFPLQCLAVLMLGTAVFTSGVAATAFDETDEAQKEKAKDPYAVPEDGSPKELLEFINELKVTRARSLEENGKKFAALAEASERLLNHKDADDKQKASAAQAAFSALGISKRIATMTRNAAEGKKVDAKILSLANELKDSKDPNLRDAARGELLKSRANNVAKLDKAEKDALIEDLVKYLEAEGGNFRARFGVGSTIARGLEGANAREQAAAVYTKLGKAIEKSGEESLQRYAPKMEGAARRVMLIGNPVDIKGKTVDGKPFDWKDYKGKVVLVDFWATWCGPCIQELPNVQKQYELYHDKGFEVVAISLDRANAKEKLETFIKDKEISWVNLFSDDEKAAGWDHPMATHYGIMSIPSTMLVDQKGNVVSLSARGPALGQQLKKLLGPADEKSEDKKDEATKTDE